MAQERTKILKNNFLSIFALIFIIAWASSLPTRFISFSTITPLAIKAFNGLIFTLSHSSGVVFGWFLVRKSHHIKIKLQITSLLCLIGTVILFLFDSDLNVITILVLFFFYGTYIAFISQVVQTQIPSEKRVLAIGFLIFSRALLAFVSYPKFQDLNPLKPFSSSLVMILIVIITSCFIQQNHLEDVTASSSPNVSRKATTSLVYLLVYFLILSITKGLMIQQLSYHTLFATTNLSISIFASYTTAVFFVILASKRPNLRIILYIANSLLIIAVLAFSLTRDSVFLLLSVNVLLYFSFAINELFCFHSFFEIGDVLGNGALTFGLTFTISSLGMLTGKMFAEFNHIAQIVSIESLIVLLFSVLTILLPSFLVKLTKLSKKSIFRINPVDQDLVTFENTSNLVQDAELAVKMKSTNIYPELKNYDTLTNREKEVLDLLIKGYPSEVILSTLFISNNTLKRHVQNIYYKLNIHSRAELFRLINNNS
jgi:DNA-binding CsgD family transcriptional regulator